MTQHKYYDAIVAWAEGRPIQYKSREGNWVTHTQEITTPGFNSFEWRVKPIAKYRVALVQIPTGAYKTVTEDYSKDVFLAAGCVGFIRYITDWIEYDV